MDIFTGGPLWWPQELVSALCRWCGPVAFFVWWLVDLRVDLHPYFLLYSWAQSSDWKNRITDTRVAGPSHLSRRLRSPTWGGVLSISFEEETLGYMQGTLERLCLSAGPAAAPTDGLEQVAQEKKVWASLIKLLRPSPRYVGSDGWMRSL